MPAPPSRPAQVEAGGAGDSGDQFREQPADLGHGQRDEPRFGGAPPFRAVAGAVAVPRLLAQRGGDVVTASGSVQATDVGRYPTAGATDVGSMCARQFWYRMTPGGTT